MSIRAKRLFLLQPADRWLTVVRVAWLLVAIAVLVLLIPEFAATLTAVKQLCTDTSNCSDPQLTARAAHTLRSAGISLDTFGRYHIALVLVNVVVCYAVAAALMLRRSADRMVLFTAFAIVLLCTPGNLPIREATGVWAEPSHLLVVLGTISGSLLLYLFPTGSFVPRWTVLLAIGFITLGLLPGPSLPGPLSLLVWFGFLISIIALQIYRYRKVSTPLQQQQTKLVVLGIGAFCGMLIVGGLIWQGDPNIEKQAIPALLVQTLGVLSPLPIIAGIGFAVLRHRLWDVDVFINRTLIYLVLTASLALVYLASVLGLQTLSRAVTGQQSDLTIVISTLIIAVLFNPLRHRIQDLIARTFYRRKYDAARILTDFGATCRDETDLEMLRATMLRVVEETMQPGHVSVWLREETARGR